ncbi:MAG: hypothetical protein PHV62_08560 [Sulfuricurvum sp.]|nr:hypothetical protein [Sulfuricurvum sp.]
MTINGYGNSIYTSYVAKNSNNTQETRHVTQKADLAKSEELDQIQKSGGFVNTMAELSLGEKALYDEFISNGESEAAQGLLLIGMSRIGMKDQQIQLPNGDIFDPINTEVTSKNVRNLFKYAFIGNDGHTDHVFDTLALALDKRNK